MKNSFGQYLKECRENANISQGVVAKKLGYSTPQFISNWERNVSKPPVVILKKLANMYGIEAEPMFSELLESEISELKTILKRKFQMSRVANF